MDQIRRFHTEDPFRFETYYDAFSPITFQSEILPLTLKEAKAILECKEKIQMMINKSNFENQPILSNDELFKCARSQSSHPEILEEFERKVNQTLDQLCFREGAFIKLSTRSPKDSVLRSPKLRQLICDELKNQLSQDSGTWFTNATNAFIRSACYATRITSASEALELFCLSNRISEDLRRTELITGEDDFDMQIILRKWVNFDPIYEFRGFVSSGELCACSQYYKLSYTPHIYENRELISSLILDFFNREVKPRVGTLQDYTVDFVLSADLTKIWVIELNNPPPVASTSMFNWNKPEDKKELQSLPFKLRVNPQPLQEDLLRQQIYQPILPFFKSISPAYVQWGQATADDEEDKDYEWLTVTGATMFTLGVFCLAGAFLFFRQRSLQS